MRRMFIVHLYFTSNILVWLKLLIQNRRGLFGYIFRVLWISLIALLTSPLQLVEWLIAKYRASQKPQIQDPVFIIGHWRSGTTFLHYLLAQDKRLGFLSYYQGFIPNLSVAGGWLLRQAFSRILPNKRPQDNIEIGMNLPSEEENAIATFSTHSASHSFFFPKNESYYQKYALFEGVSKTEKSNWKRDYQRMLSKISWSNGHKKLLIKNPHNTSRMKELLEIYPNAKFIHIYRDPIDVIPSTYLMYDHVVMTQYLQEYGKEETMDKIFYYYKSLMNRFFEQKKTIPTDQFFEIKFEELELNPLPIIKKMYRHFNWDLDPAQNAIQEFVQSQKSYKKNKHSLPASLKRRIEKECKFVHDIYYREAPEVYADVQTNK